MQPLNTELILIRITGEDRPGLTVFRDGNSGEI